MVHAREAALFDAGRGLTTDRLDIAADAINDAAGGGAFELVGGVVDALHRALEPLAEGAARADEIAQVEVDGRGGDGEEESRNDKLHTCGKERRKEL